MKIEIPKVQGTGCEAIAAECEVNVSDLIQFGFGLKKAEEAIKVIVPIKEKELHEAFNNLKFKQSV